MLPFGIGFSEIILVFLVLIIVVGPDGIPQAVRTIAKVIRTLRSFVDEIRYSEEFDEVKREILDPIQEARRYNPRAQVRDWVRREIEEPVRQIKDEVIQDLNAEFHQDASRKETPDSSSHESAHALEGSAPQGELGEAFPSIQGMIHAQNEDSQVNQDEVITRDDGDEGEDEGEDDVWPVPSLDPLDRGITHTHQDQGPSTPNEGRGEARQEDEP